MFVVCNGSELGAGMLPQHRCPNVERSSSSYPVSSTLKTYDHVSPVSPLGYNARAKAGGTI